MTCYMPHALPPPQARGHAKHTVRSRSDPPPKTRRPNYGRDIKRMRSYKHFGVLNLRPKSPGLNPNPECRGRISQTPGRTSWLPRLIVPPFQGREFRKDDPETGTRSTGKPCALGQGGKGSILGKRHTSYYGNYSPLEGQDRQVMTWKGREGRFGWPEGARTFEAGVRGAHRGEGWREFREVLKGTAPDLS